MSLILSGRNFKLNGGSTPPIVTDSIVYPPEVQFTNIVPVAMSMPGYLVKTEDTSYPVINGIRHYLMLVTDETAWGKAAGSSIRAHYSKTGLFNCDRTRCIIDGKLLDCSNMIFNVIGNVDNDGTNMQWDGNDPDLYWNVNGGKIICMRASTNTTVSEVNLTALGWSSVTKGASEGCMDNNNRYMPLQGTLSGIGTCGYYDLQTSTLVTRPNTFFGGTPDWITISQSGLYVIQRSSGGTMQNKQYDLNFNFLNNLGYGSHEDTGYNFFGQECLVQHIYIGWKSFDNFVFNSGYVPNDPNSCEVDQFRTSWNTQWNNGEAMGSHTTARNIQRPGWYYSASANGYRELYAIKADNGRHETMRANRFGFAREAPGTVQDYTNHEPKVCCSMDGKIMSCPSNWGSPTQGHTYMFWCEQT